MDDVISRQQAIDAVNCVMIMKGIRSGKSVAAEAIESVKSIIADNIRQLPSAEPTFDARDTQYNLPIGTDLISRAQAIDTLENTKTAISENGERYIAKQNAIMRIDALPSAQPKLLQPWEVLVAQAVLPQPKRGKWILDRSGAYCCSECMEPCATYVMMKPRDKFCKMCGSRNEVTE